MCYKDEKESVNNKVIICIPRVAYNITHMQINDVFTKLNIGKIQKIDIVIRYTEKREKYKRVFIHLWNWNDENETMLTIKNKLLDGKEIKVVYSDPWYWKISVYKVPVYKSLVFKKEYNV